jgi:hypothetical protein
MAKEIKSFPNVYEMVIDGEWTLEEMENVARIIGGQNVDGKPGLTNTDKFGFGTTNLSKYYQTSGIQQVSVNEATGKYEISLNDGRVSTLVPKLIEYKNAEWARTSWDAPDGEPSGYGAMQTAFGEKRLLFYNEVVQKFDYFGDDNENNIKAGAVPMPKLNADQEDYYTPTTYQACLLCVPTTTPSKNMSTYFLDVLSWSGQDYVMRAFTERLEAKLYDDGESSREDALEMLTDYIFPNIMYDQGFIYSYPGQNIMSTVQSDTISRATSSSSDFTQLYTEAFPDANDKLNNKDTGWNTYAKNYTDAIKVEG